MSQAEATNRETLLDQLSRILDEDGPERVDVGEDVITVRTYALKSPAVVLIAEGIGAKRIETHEEIDLNAGEELAEVEIELRPPELTCPDCGGDTFNWYAARTDQGTLYVDGQRDTEETDIGDVQVDTSEVTCAECDTGHHRSDLVPAGEQ
jgi:Zn finger protein HypA/HybF involved in hydrogenase expression